MTAVLFWRSRGLVWLLASVAAVGLACWAVPLGLIANPVSGMRYSLVEGVPGLGAGVLLSFLVADPMAEMEGTVPRVRLVLSRLSWLALALVGFVGAGVIGLVVRHDATIWQSVAHVRACLMGLGLGIASGSVLPRQIAWLPPVAYLVACWIGGILDVGGHAAWWAVPCYRADSCTAAVAAVIGFMGGAVVYLWRGGWPLRAGE